MNLRPSGYEPDELPGCSTPRRQIFSRRKGGGCGPGGDLLFRTLRCSTIGAEGFHGRVRDGIGCFAPRYDHQAGKACPGRRWRSGHGVVPWVLRAVPGVCHVRRKKKCLWAASGPPLCACAGTSFCASFCGRPLTPLPALAGQVCGVEGFAAMRGGWDQGQSSD